jgi:hypothetical protein
MPHQHNTRKKWGLSVTPTEIRRALPGHLGVADGYAVEGDEFAIEALAQLLDPLRHGLGEGGRIQGLVVAV